MNKTKQNPVKPSLSTLNVRIASEKYAELQKLCDNLREHGQSTNINAFVQEAFTSYMNLITCEERDVKLPKFIGVSRYALSYDAPALEP